MWGAILGGLTGLASSALSWFGQKDTNEKAMEEAEKNRAWQEYMSNTQHQREVKDLKEAGLNPILSAKYGGAGIGSPVQPSLVSPARDVASSMNSAKLMSEVGLTRELIKTEKSKQKMNVASAKREEAVARLNEYTAVRERMQSELDKLTFSAVNSNFLSKGLQATLRQLGLPSWLPSGAKVKH